MFLLTEQKPTEAIGLTETLSFLSGFGSSAENKLDAPAFFPSVSKNISNSSSAPPLGMKS